MLNLTKNCPIGTDGWITPWRTGPGLIAVMILLATMVTWSAVAEGPDDDYVRIYSMVQQADSLKAKGSTNQALAKYEAAQAAIQDFRTAYPTWKSGLVSFRWKYVTGQIAALKAPATSPAEAPASAQAEAKPAAVGSSPVKLLDAGAEPRQVLRWHPKPGDRQQVGMTLKLGIAMKAGEMEVPAMDLPTMKFPMELTVKEVTSEGDVVYEMIMGKASLVEGGSESPQAEAIKAALGNVEGMSGTGRFTSRGIGKGTEIKAAPNADPQLRQALDQMKQTFPQLSVPLPEEAVGPGAKWELKLPIKSQGITLNQSASYELTSMEGDKIAVATTIKQQAANQKIQNPAMPGMKMDLTKMEGTGTGKIVGDLTQILPSEGTMELKTDMAMGMDVGGQQQKMNMNVNINLRLGSN